jgi:beta-glucosidase
MPSYSEFDGVPISASHAVLTGMLRDKMGFTGTTVSDYVAVGFLHTRQKVAGTPEGAGSLALAAGMDVETPAVSGYGAVLAKAVREGKVPESLLDRSVRRVLRDKFALGLFDNPYVSEDAITIRAVASEGVDLSRRLAAESVTLLKNENGVLPRRRDIAKIAIVGPHADDVEAGVTTYTYRSALKMMHARATGSDIAMAGVDLGGGAPPDGEAAVAAELAPVFKADRREYIKSNYSSMSLAEAVRKLLPTAEVTAVSGTGVVPKEPTDIPAAVAAARNADVVILAVGGRSAWSNERTEGEGSDTANKDLPPQQVELINAVTAVGKPTVAVVAMGRPQGLAAVTLRGRHGHRCDAPRAATHWVRATRARARCIEGRHVRGADERARLHGNLRRRRRRARSGGGERGQQLERHPIQRDVHRHRTDASHQRRGPRVLLGRDRFIEIGRSTR